MKLLELTGINGLPILINPNNVVAITSNYGFDDQTRIEVGFSKNYVVQENIARIQALMMELGE